MSYPIKEYIKSCPFCKSSNIRYSCKKSGRWSECYYSASMYCFDCNSYGPRVLSEKFEDRDYSRAREIREDSELRRKAIDAWNCEDAECEYCNDPNPARDCILPDGIERMLVAYPDGSIFGKPFIHERNIRFCPMCGKPCRESVGDIG